MCRYILALGFLFAMPFAAATAAGTTDPAREILVTFDNHNASRASAGASAPYRNRKRYAIAAEVRKDARAVESQYALTKVDHWPIKSLSIYCFVYRIPEASDRDEIVARLRADDRVESVQALHEFETGTIPDVSYDDTYANLQHGLSALDITAAHRYSTGHGIRVAIIDSDADIDHEDLEGRFSKRLTFTDAGRQRNADHGTAVASIIGAIANNATGIVGVAPGSQLEAFVSCWHDAAARKAVCDSFTLAKAIDSLLENPPDILNLSLTGPSDALLERLLTEVARAGVVVIAAEADEPARDNHFPASLPDVIGVASSVARPDKATTISAQDANRAVVYAPGTRVLVALPDDAYDMRSGSSLAAAHVSGVVALLLSVSPEQPTENIAGILFESQSSGGIRAKSVNACRVLQLVDHSRSCRLPADQHISQNENVTLNTIRESASSEKLTNGTARVASW